MPIDFRNLSNRGQSQAITDPRQVFLALPGKDPKFEYLRDGQGQVLEKWAERRTERDLIIKSNTGGGKTAVGLLILQTCLNEGKGPALYVAPDNYLVAQVCKEATKLGLATVNNPDDSRYLAGEGIGVVNIFTLMNGRSKFGAPGSQRSRPLPIGSLVVDDAHAALAITQQQFSITLPASHPMYSELLRIFGDDLERYAPGPWLAIRSGDSAVLPIQIPFWCWAREARTAAELLQANAEDDAIEWSWPLIRDCLPLCHAVVSARELEVVPPCPPVELITGFNEAKRRVFLTATLADDSVLVGTFGAEPTSIAKPIAPDSAADLGDRMILAPQDISPAISEDEIKQAVADLGKEVNVVVLVPSGKRSTYWGDVSAVTADRDAIEGVVDRLQAGEHIGVVVLEQI